MNRNRANKPEHVQLRTDLARRLHEHGVATDDPLLRGAVTAPQHETTRKLLQAARRTRRPAADTMSRE